MDTKQWAALQINIVGENSQNGYPHYSAGQKFGDSRYKNNHGKAEG
jgi:hypothetical protein